MSVRKIPRPPAGPGIAGRIRRFPQRVIRDWLLTTWGIGGPPPSRSTRPWLAAGALARRVLPSPLRNRLRRFLLARVDLAWELPCHGAEPILLRVRGRAELALHYEIFRDRCYDEAILCALRRWRSGTRLRVLDLGTNVGFFLLRVVALAPSALRHDRRLCLTAVEANPGIVPELRRRLETDNGLAAETDLRIAVGLAGRRSGTGRLHLAPLHSQSSLAPERGARSIAAPYLDLEALFPDADPIGLLKCDIEGAEEELLETYPELLRRTEVAVFELHPLLCDAERCCRLLRDYGFRELRILSAHPDTRLLWVSRSPGALPAR